MQRGYNNKVIGKQIYIARENYRKDLFEMIFSRERSNTCLTKKLTFNITYKSLEYN